MMGRVEVSPCRESSRKLSLVLNTYITRTLCVVHNNNNNHNHNHKHNHTQQPQSQQQQHCGRFYPVILDLHQFFIDISRAVVNHDGWDGSAPDPLVWSAGALSKRRRLVHAVRYRAFLPGPPGIWDGVGSMFLHPLSVLMILLVGLTSLVSWLNGSPF